MPGVERLSIDAAVAAAREAEQLGIPAIALFPATDPGLKTADGREATNPDNLICRTVRANKARTGNIGILSDVALDPYTSHGHDGLMQDADNLNDKSVAVMVEQALAQARAGCDTIAPSGPRDGRVTGHRKAVAAGG